LQVQVEWGDM